MIKLLIVDDEPLAREMICNLIRKNVNYEIVADCYSGEMALEIIEKNHVDIVITDIKMTKMTGIQFIEKARLLYPYIFFVVLSAYNDFEFVRNSFQLGIEDYIVKTEISYERLTDVIDKIKNKIEDRVIKCRNSLMKDSLMRELVLNSNRREGVLHELSQYNFTVDIKNMSIMLIKIIDYTNYIKNEFDFDEKLINYGIKNIMFEILDEVPFQGEFFYYTNGEFVLFCSFRDIHSENRIITEIENVYLKFKNAIKKYMEREVTAGLSECGNNITELFMHAELAVKMNYINKNERIEKYNPVFKNQSSLSLDFYVNEINRILKEFLMGNYEYTFTLPEFNSGKVSVNDVEAIRRMYEQIIYIIKNFSDSHSNLIKLDFERYFNYLKDYGNVYDMHEYVISCLDSIRDQLSIGTRISDLVVRYIMKNYTSQILLTDVGKSLGFNANYIGRVFKKEMGIGFSEYVIKIKINKAKELIRLNKYNISEISSMLGFKNMEHFSRTFKRITKKTPSEYKR